MLLLGFLVQIFYNPKKFKPLFREICLLKSALLIYYINLLGSIGILYLKLANTKALIDNFILYS